MSASKRKGRDARALRLFLFSISQKAQRLGERILVATVSSLQLRLVMPGLVRASTPIRRGKSCKIIAAPPRGWPGQARPGRVEAVRGAELRSWRAQICFPGQPRKERDFRRDWRTREGTSPSVKVRTREQKIDGSRFRADPSGVATPCRNADRVKSTKGKENRP